MDRLGLVPRAAADDLTRPVRWVHVSELADPTPYLRGGELLLLAGTQLPTTREAYHAYARRLADVGVAGLGFGVAPIHDEVPADLVDACAACRLPLLEVPRDVPFLAISELFSRELLAAEVAGLRRLADAQSTLTRAATGPGALPGTVTALARAVGGWALLVDANRGRRWTAGPRPDDAEVTTALDRVLRSTRPASANVHAADTHALVQWVRGPAPSGYALAVGKREPFDVTDRAVTTVAASLISLLLTDPVDRFDPYLVGAAVVRGVLGDGDVPAAAAEAAGASGETRWRVFRCRPARRRTAGAAGAAGLLQTPFVDLCGRRLTALRPDRDDLPDVLAELAAAGWLAGVSTPRPWDMLAIGGREAEAALRTAVVTGAPAVAGERPGGGLADLMDPDLARAFAKDVLAPIEQARTPQPPELLATLRAWLAHHGSWDRTAAALGVHRNTVRHRIAQVQRLLGRDLSDPDTRMELWFALRWLS